MCTLSRINKTNNQQLNNRVFPMENGPIYCTLLEWSIDCCEFIGARLLNGPPECEINSEWVILRALGAEYFHSSCTFSPIRKSEPECRQAVFTPSLSQALYSVSQRCTDIDLVTGVRHSVTGDNISLVLQIRVCLFGKQSVYTDTTSAL